MLEGICVNLVVRGVPSSAVTAETAGLEIPAAAADQWGPGDQAVMEETSCWCWQSSLLVSTMTTTVRTHNQTNVRLWFNSRKIWTFPVNSKTTNTLFAHTVGKLSMNECFIYISFKIQVKVALVSGLTGPVNKSGLPGVTLNMHHSLDHWNWWSPLTYTEPAAATEQRTRTTPAGTDPGLLGPGNRPGLLTWTTNECEAPYTSGRLVMELF